MLLLCVGEGGGCSHVCVYVCACGMCLYMYEGKCICVCVSVCLYVYLCFGTNLHITGLSILYEHWKKYKVLELSSL